MKYHDLLNRKYSENSPHCIWRSMPSADSWGANETLLARLTRNRSKRLVGLGSLVSSIQQGVSGRTMHQGGKNVNVLRSADINPPSIGSGIPATVPNNTMERLLRPGDVLMPRIGNADRAGYVQTESPLLLAGQELLILRLKNPRIAPLVAASLSTESAKEMLRGFAIGSKIPTLNIQSVKKLLIPNPDEILKTDLVDQLIRAESLLTEAENDLNTVRSHLDRFFEDAPMELPNRQFQWIQSGRMPEDWSWQYALKDWLIKNGERRLYSGIRLGELPGINIQRGGLIKSAGSAIRLNTDGFRPHWHLAILEAIKIDSSQQPVETGVELNTPALLIPMVGAIDAQPIYIDNFLIESAGGSVIVPAHWGVITGFGHLRTLAFVLDHPFVRLQRSMSSVASTVAHIPIKIIKHLLIPNISQAQWNLLEQQIQRAHQNLFDAAEIYQDTIQELEKWYDESIV